MVLCVAAALMGPGRPAVAGGGAEADGLSARHDALVYVADLESDTVSVVDAPNGLAVSPAGSRVYVSNFNADTLSVIDTATARSTDTVAVGSGPTGVAAARGKRA